MLEGTDSGPMMRARGPECLSLCRAGEVPLGILFIGRAMPGNSSLSSNYTMFIQDFGDVVIASLQNLWNIFVAFLPNLIVALIVFIIGWVIAAALGRVVTQIIRALKIDSLFEKLGLRRPVERAGLRLDIGHFIGQLVKWFLILVFLMAATDILGLTQVTDFLQVVLFYIPSIIVAVIILLLGVMLAEFTQRLIRASVDAAGLMSAGFLATLAKWAIFIFALFAALDQLGVANTFIITVLQGLVAMLAIAGGLAFGLGGQNAAKDFISRVRDEMKPGR